MENEINLKSEYYILYYQFLELDKKSLLYGRNDELIIAFMLYYKALIENQKEKTNKIKDRILDKFLELEISPKQIKPYTKECKLKNNLKLHFKEFFEAIKLFNNFRKKIGKKNRENIAKKMLEYRLQYYNFFILDVEKIEYIEYKEKNITYFPLQVLNEFHNTMSHLCSIFITTRSNDNNINRAENHLKRAILDIYKVIIKDFFIIKQDVTKIRDDVAEIRNDVAEIRDLEYKTIGTDRIITIIEAINSKNNKHKDDIFKKYKEVCGKIINFYN
ncbi:hypothetical protein ACMZXH_000127 [Campylobacter jejuni]|uniref:hypothetical protein n=2 Tax=Campylobacter jejuni TaxID=197 RepID=UPI00069A96B9|nr:hypothetical protein [Campylobacter jejuni]EAI3977619.1 hypothetical protein [Campylobacter jejuni]ECL2991162.1 hypothetical protein [Campylobacter jejuni]ECL3523465.1 hypothetical protein [Campylobacter jejuni]ECL9066607.1 hypothetical protein [Campylobacter jejuni]ECM6554756.1 hypothetical protein [Campylobacter jejuni]